GRDGTALNGVSIDRVVNRASIVPNSHRAGCPMKTASEFRARAMLINIVEQGSALRLRHILESQRVNRVNKERLASTYRIKAHDRMCHLAIGFRIVALDSDRPAGT